jgi:hypothetical protein
MPFGTFLDSFPPALYIVIHLILLSVGVWAVMKAKSKQLKYASAFWLYVVVHLGFFSAFWRTLYSENERCG